MEITVGNGDVSIARTHTQIRSARFSSPALARKFEIVEGHVADAAQRGGGVVVVVIRAVGGLAGAQRIVHRQDGPRPGAAGAPVGVDADVNRVAARSAPSPGPRQAHRRTRGVMPRVSAPENELVSGFGCY